MAKRSNRTSLFDSPTLQPPLLPTNPVRPFPPCPDCRKKTGTGNVAAGWGEFPYLFGCKQTERRPYEIFIQSSVRSFWRQNDGMQNSHSFRRFLLPGRGLARAATGTSPSWIVAWRHLLIPRGNEISVARWPLPSWAPRFHSAVFPVHCATSSRRQA